MTDKTKLFTDKISHGDFAKIRHDVAGILGPHLRFCLVALFQDC